ncbi:MAG: hypothetical protein Q8K93_32555, partial [Reyranella sp.]|nr:hypothetical protein [Reyranella sp.]
IDPTGQVISLKELTEIVVKHYQLHEGRYELAMGLRVAVGKFQLSEEVGPVPGSFVGIENVRLARVPDDAQGTIVVDAAHSNPAPKSPVAAKAKPPVAKPRPKKAISTK